MEFAEDEDVSSRCDANRMLIIAIGDIAASNKQLVNTNVDLEAEKQRLNEYVRKLEDEKQRLNDKVRERDTDIYKLAGNNTMLANKLNASQLACDKLEAKVYYFENEKSQQTERNRKLEAANKRLQIEADELKTEYEELKTDYEPLEAANKDLEAANKTLRAANKLLEAKNSKFEALVRTACDKLEANAFNFENEKSRQEATIEDLRTQNCRLEAANEWFRLECEALKVANDELGLLTKIS